MSRSLASLTLLTAALGLTPLVPRPSLAQQGGAGEPAVARIVVEPASLTLDVNDTARVKATAYDAAGRVLRVPVTFFSTGRRSVEVDTSGRVIAHGAGEYHLIALVIQGSGQPSSTRGDIPVVVRAPAVARVAIEGAPYRYYTGTTVRHRARVIDRSGAERSNVPVSWRSSDPAVLSVDRFGDVTAVAPGQATLTAIAGGAVSGERITVIANPATALELTASAADARTGDVVHYSAVARDASGGAVRIPVSYSVQSDVEDSVMAPAAPAEIDQQGRFVAQRAGTYTVIATAGNLVARQNLAVTHRYTTMRMDAAMPKEKGTGHGAVRDIHSSDLWVWTGKDGRDYAITGTWGANGDAYFWDVTDAGHPVKVDSLRVDARTVNDVKVDVERELCIMSREGASNRKNGFVVVDCSNPRDVKVLSTFDDGLYGGVHNVFVWNEHVFAINAGTRFDIISIQDPKQPKRVSFFELGTPGHGIHDVWVVDGIAYASQWEDGIIVVDVGGAGKGGSLAAPKQIGQYAYPIGATHSAFPYKAKDGRFYVFVGDEQFPYGLDPDAAAQAEAGGYIHIVDFTDWSRPEEVARYQVPEAGPHNFWIQNDSLFVGYYNAGLRVVDISGELKGNLYEQGRELVRFRPMDPNGKVANTPFIWGPQPLKGHVFMTDFNSGLWAVELPKRTVSVTP